MEWKLGSIVKWGIQGGKKYMLPFIQRYKKDNLALFTKPTNGKRRKCSGANRVGTYIF